jgi:hypothetical protein
VIEPQLAITTSLFPVTVMTHHGHDQQTSDHLPMRGDRERAPNNQVRYCMKCRVC